VLPDPAIFLNDVFEAIRYKLYLPGARPPPKIESPAFSSPLAATAPNFMPGSIPTPNFVPNQSMVPQPGPRKRGYVDYDAPAGTDNPFTGQRAYKQPRRGKGGRAGRSVGSGYGRGQLPWPGQFDPGAMPLFDQDNPMEAILRLQAMGLPIPNIRGLGRMPRFGEGPSRQQNGLRQRCRDFDTKGFCTRPGCVFDHGSDPVLAPGPIPLPNEGESRSSILYLSEWIGISPVYQWGCGAVWSQRPSCHLIERH